jgi:predicted outer membrane repeat protein
MRIRGAVLLAVLSAFAPACGGGGSGGGGGGLVFAPLTPLDTTTPDHIIDTTQVDASITAQLQTALNSGGIIVFNNAGAKTVTLTAELSLPTDNTAVIDGKGTITLSGGSARRILNKQFHSTLTLQRLAFIDGRATDFGGAIRVVGGEGYLTVINCQFTNCKTTLAGPDIGGGAIRPLRQNLLQVSGCTFTDCDGSNGGAIVSIGSQILLINSTFTQCNAFGTGGGADVGGNGGLGGAVYVDGVSQIGDKHRLDIVGCTFTSNSAEDHGGALFAYTIDGTGSSVFIDQSTFSLNAQTDATPVVGLGGAVYQQGNTFTVTRSTFDGNTSIKQGGGIWSSCKSGTIENCTFQGNQATGAPGFGGAMVLNGAFLVSSCTIAGNHAAGWGGGIFAGDNGDKVTLRNSLLMSNTGVNATNGWNVNATLGAGSNNLQWPGGGGATNLPARPNITFADAGLSALANNAGPVNPWPTPRTMAITGGPAVNAGASSAPKTDQRGVVRSGAPDIGAFEKNP